MRLARSRLRAFSVLVALQLFLLASAGFNPNTASSSCRLYFGTDLVFRKSQVERAVQKRISEGTENGFHQVMLMQHAWHRNFDESDLKKFDPRFIFEDPYSLGLVFQQIRLKVWAQVANQKSTDTILNDFLEDWRLAHAKVFGLGRGAFNGNAQAGSKHFLKELALEVMADFGASNQPLDCPHVFGVPCSGGYGTVLGLQAINQFPDLANLEQVFNTFQNSRKIKRDLKGEKNSPVEDVLASTFSPRERYLGRRKYPYSPLPAMDVDRRVAKDIFRSWDHFNHLREIYWVTVLGGSPKLITSDHTADLSDANSSFAEASDFTDTKYKKREEILKVLLKRSPQGTPTLDKSRDLARFLFTAGQLTTLSAVAQNLGQLTRPYGDVETLIAELNLELGANFMIGRNATTFKQEVFIQVATIIASDNRDTYEGFRSSAPVDQFYVSGIALAPFSLTLRELNQAVANRLTHL